jgi:hypothetical protein
VITTRTLRATYGKICTKILEESLAMLYLRLTDDICVQDTAKFNKEMDGLEWFLLILSEHVPDAWENVLIRNDQRYSKALRILTAKIDDFVL